MAAAQAKGQPWSRARALRCQGMLTGTDRSGRADGGQADGPGGFAAVFEEAIALHALTPDGFEAARTRLAYGGRLRRARSRVRAREQLRAAAEVFERLDAQPWADRARAELAATGETRRARDPNTLDELTPQELQIAVLLTGGKTTREAAAALFLSPKTVEYHLRHVYQKLGINSRDELARILAVQGSQAAGGSGPADGSQPAGDPGPLTNPRPPADPGRPAGPGAYWAPGPDAGRRSG
jgi:DNA-binding CsgD family transcriptional regulator